MRQSLLIGDLARRTGTKVNTIRFYEESGLLPHPARTASGRRTYGIEDLSRLTFIRHARSLGFGLGVVRSLLELAGHPERECGAAAEIATSHLADVEQRLRQLKALRTELRRMIAECGEGRRVADCFILGALGTDRSSMTR
jgi:DNA-binding transcriptional MerR regulator